SALGFSSGYAWHCGGFVVKDEGCSIKSSLSPLCLCPRYAYRKRHLDITIAYQNTNDAVKAMIKRAEIDINT
ncbi:MAG: hypothetical protein HFP77_00900, partial [Methylococcales symbiont of Iophon sp. n. MRB-2018]